MEVKKKQPLYQDYVPLGKGVGINISLWGSSLQLQRRERDDNGNWKTTQEFNLAPRVLEYIFARIPIWIEKMKKQ